jgi:nucleoside-diphosphate-sugar epimerase
MTSLALITGGTGFVGRHVISQLHARRIPMRVVIRTGKQRSLPSSVPFESVIETTDLFSENFAWWKRACEGVSVVVHLAWYAEPGLYINSPSNLHCIAGTCVLASAAMAERVHRFIGIGTCFEYDTSTGTLDISTPLKPASPYAATKAATFLALSEILPAGGVEFVWCRLFYLYGEGEDPRRLIRHIRNRLRSHEPVLLGSGRHVRDYLDVADAARLIADTVNGSVVGPVNICSGRAITVRQLAESIADEYGGRHLLCFNALADRPFDPPVVVGVATPIT